MKPWQCFVISFAVSFAFGCIVLPPLYALSMGGMMWGCGFLFPYLMSRSGRSNGPPANE